MTILRTERIAPLIPRHLALRFAAARADGRLNPALDPHLLVVSLIGLTMLPLAARPIWSRIFGITDRSHEDRLRHTLALVAHGVGVRCELV